MNKDELFDYCKEWLAVWTGNRPNDLIKFYSKDALYVDPAHKDGLRGHNEILPYFKKLLAVYDEWVWTPIEIFPIDKGVIVKWKVKIPMNGEVIEETGIDIVELDGKMITRNEVYFDRTRLMAAVKRKKGAQRLATL